MSSPPQSPALFFFPDCSCSVACKHGAAAVQAGFVHDCEFDSMDSYAQRRWFVFTLRLRGHDRTGVSLSFTKGEIAQTKENSGCCDRPFNLSIADVHLSIGST